MNFDCDNFKGNEKGAALLYRFLGVRVAALFRSTPVTANQLSAAGFIAGVGAALLYAQGTAGSLAYGTLLYQLCIILDYADGTLARFKNQCSYFGEWVEAVLDPLREFLVISGICWGLYQVTADPWIWILGFILASTNFMMDILALTFEAFPFAEQGVRTFSPKNIIYIIARHIITIRTTRYLAIVPFALADRMYLFLVVFCLYNTLVFFLMVFQLGLVIRKQDALKKNLAPNPEEGHVGPDKEE